MNTAGIRSIMHKGHESRTPMAPPTKMPQKPERIIPVVLRENFSCVTADSERARRFRKASEQVRSFAITSIQSAYVSQVSVTAARVASALRRSDRKYIDARSRLLSRSTYAPSSFEPLIVAVTALSWCGRLVHSPVTSRVPPMGSRPRPHICRSLLTLKCGRVLALHLP